MEEEKDLYPGEVNLPEFLGKLKIGITEIFKYWKWIFGISILSGLIGWYYAESLPENYVAEIVFVIEGKGNQNQGISSGLANQLGIRDNNLNEGLYSINNFIGLLTYSKMIRETLTQRYPNDTTQTFGGEYLAIKNRKDPYFPGVGIEINKINRLQMNSLKSLTEEIKGSLSIETGFEGTSFNKLIGSFEDEIFAKLFTEALLNKTVQFYIEGKTGEHVLSIRQIEARKDSLYEKLFSKSKKLSIQKSQYLDLNPAFASSMINVELLNGENEILAKLYSEVLTTLEIRKRELFELTPIIKIIDLPDYPLEKKKTNRIKWFTISILFGFLFSIVLFLIFKKNK